MSKSIVPAKFTRELLKKEIARVEKELVRFDRGSFRKELARLLNIRPTTEALKAFANKHPDKWAQTVTMLANLSGFHQGVNVFVSGGVDPSQMTDVALIAEVRRLSGEVVARARGAAGEVVDIEAVPVSTTPAVLPAPEDGNGS